MAEFKTGEHVALVGGTEAIVEQKLGEGGQGIVYSVKIDGKSYALKWYTCQFSNKEVFKKNMQANIMAGPPNTKFLWPLMMTTEQSVGGTGKTSFGYIMNLRPKEYSDFSSILNNKVQFPSMELCIEAALNIVNGFRELHRKGLSYQDLNDGNFFINVENGDVLICDDDNVTPGDQENPGNIRGKPGYMAPEIVAGKAHPGSLTDYHSLAVILFKLFIRHDPLMGEAYVKSTCITEKREIELYGSHPVFIFDPNDKSNRPVPGVHPNPINLWPEFPAFFQKAFIQSFVEGMKNPNSRLTENEWQKKLVLLRAGLLSCPAGHSEAHEDFLQKFKPGEAVRFDCGHSYSYPFMLNLGTYRIPLFPGMKLYACQTVKDSDIFDSVTGEVLMNKTNPKLWGLRNLSEDTWFFTPPNGGEAKPVEKGKVMPVGTGVKISFKGVEGQIQKESVQS